MTSLLAHDINSVVTTLQTKNYRNKKHPQRQNDDNHALSAKSVLYDLEATLPHLRFTIEEKPTPDWKRWHIELRSVRSRILSLKNLLSHAQKK